MFGCARCSVGRHELPTSGVHTSSQAAGVPHGTPHDMRRAGRVPDEADLLMQESDIVDAVEKVPAAENRPARLLNRARTRGSDPRECVATHTHRRGLTRVQGRGIAPCYFFLLLSRSLDDHGDHEKDRDARKDDGVEHARPSSHLEPFSSLRHAAPPTPHPVRTILPQRRVTPAGARARSVGRGGATRDTGPRTCSKLD